MTWRYRLLKDYSYHSPLLCGVRYEGDWLTIESETITAHARYSWDGCSPKYRVLGLFDVGVPDGALLYGKPTTYYASLVHDALSQFRGEIPIDKRTVVALFDEMLERRKFALRPLYVWVVDRLGPQDFLLDTSGE